jgi:hypothetical protein
MGLSSNFILPLDLARQYQSASVKCWQDGIDLWFHVIEEEAELIPILDVPAVNATREIKS